MSHKLRVLGVSSKIDDSGASIGKRYSRNDELGTPLGITVDFQSVSDDTYTLRDRDSTKQVRADADKILTAIKSLVEGSKVWADIEKELPACKHNISSRTSNTPGLQNTDPVAVEGQEVDVPIR